MTGRRNRFLPAWLLCALLLLHSAAGRVATPRGHREYTLSEHSGTRMLAFSSSSSSKSSKGSGSDSGGSTRSASSKSSKSKISKRSSSSMNMSMGSKSSKQSKKSSSSSKGMSMVYSPSSPSSSSSSTSTSDDPITLPEPSPSCPNDVEMQGNVTFEFAFADREPTEEEDQQLAEGTFQFFEDLFQAAFPDTFLDFTGRVVSTDFTLEQPATYILGFTGEVQFVPCAPSYEEVQAALNRADFDDLWENNVRPEAADGPPNVLVFIESATYSGEINIVTPAPTDPSDDDFSPTGGSISVEESESEDPMEPSPSASADSPSTPTSSSTTAKSTSSTMASYSKSSHGGSSKSSKAAKSSSKGSSRKSKKSKTSRSYKSMISSASKSKSKVSKGSRSMSMISSSSSDSTSPSKSATGSSFSEDDMDDMDDIPVSPSVDESTPSPTASPTSPSVDDSTPSPAATPTSPAVDDSTHSPTAIPTSPSVDNSTVLPTAIPTSPSVDNNTVLPETPSPSSSSTSAADAVPPPNSTITTPVTNEDVCSESCDPLFLLDGICQAGQEGDLCPENGDIYDCDACQQHNFDCTSCVENGCNWCAKDARCLSKDLANCNFEKSSCKVAADWTLNCGITESALALGFSDPLNEAQEWVYNLIDVAPVWEQGFTGQGVSVRVNDPDGVDGDHVEFAGKFDVDASCDEYSPPAFTGEEEPTTHGTFVASIAAANANDACAVGIAPEATLSACIVAADETPMFLGEPEKGIDISVNSWGTDGCEYTERRLLFDECPFDPDHRFSPCRVCEDDPDSLECKDQVAFYCSTFFGKDTEACLEFLDLFVECGYNSLGEGLRNAFAKGITEGRDGRGIIYVFAAGNSYEKAVDVNMEGLMNTRFTIVVGGVDKAGKHSSFSATGAALFVSAPAGDSDDYVSNHIGANAGINGGGCGDATVGNSFACPVVAGVVALMLEANDQLGWRDVQGILATTSQKTDPDNESWTTNGNGLHHSYLYGFGLVNASAAVAAAQSWTNFGVEQQVMTSSGDVNLPIEDSVDASTTHTLFLSSAPNPFATETVVIYLTLEVANRGDLEVVLTSPQGTESILHPSPRPEYGLTFADGGTWKLSTVRNWGEDPFGEWTLSIVDKQAGSRPIGDCVDFSPDFFSVPVIQDDQNFNMTCFDFELDDACADGDVTDSDFVAEFTDPVTLIGADEACCACGGGLTITEETCIDGSLEIADPEGQEGDNSVLTCVDINFEGVCANGTVAGEDLANTADANGNTPASSCCECGGGNRLSDLSNSLISWDLVVYGHS